ncbi:MAG: N-acetyl-gamma-glutamyl-phosphate reductase [Dehalococcoidia bacterium]|nr:N-acetyl-gamma-glutamyl-phosphate reductase [Dehalococcoidia bacterium]
MTRVAILNVTGYAGAELARLLHTHPAVELAAVTGRSSVGQRLPEVFPHLWPVDLPITDEVDDSVDLVFSALPHAASAEAVVPFLLRDIPVIDLSADFRLRDAAVYERFYGRPHPAPELLSGAVYGIPEVTGGPGPDTKLVANPGCYAAGAILALAPAVASGAIESAVVDGKSGISGAGRSLGQAYHYSEANDSLSAYGLAGGGHRHRPEMDQELSRLATDGWSPLTFVPHLVPMTRGILTTAYATPARGVPASALGDAYRDFYRSSPFVRIVDTPPATKQVSGTNNCLLHVRSDDPAGRLIIVSVIDNLGRGAAAQAVHNMNRVLGLPETTGLDAVALYP